MKNVFIVPALLITLGCIAPWDIPEKRAQETARIEGIVKELIDMGSYVIVWRTEAPGATMIWLDPEGIEHEQAMVPYSNTGAMAYVNAPQRQWARMRPRWNGNLLPNGEFKHTIEIYWQGRLINRAGKVGPASALTSISLMM